MQLHAWVASRLGFRSLPPMPDFVIVGHGLAGAVLAHRLIERGYSVAVLDAGLEFSSQLDFSGPGQSVNWSEAQSAI